MKFLLKSTSVPIGINSVCDFFLRKALKITRITITPRSFHTTVCKVKFGSIKCGLFLLIRYRLSGQGMKCLPCRNESGAVKQMPDIRLYHRNRGLKTHQTCYEASVKLRTWLLVFIHSLTENIPTCIVDDEIYLSH